MTYSVAAGNDGKDASANSPANHPDVITVSAIVDTDGKCGGLGASSSSSFGKDDNFASFSNYGPKIDIAAPGVNIYSTYKGSSYAYASGTSIATPHVTGAAALYKASHPNASPSQVLNAIISSGSTKSTVCDNKGHGYFQGDPDSKAEPLLYLGFTSVGNGGTPSRQEGLKYHYSPSLALTGTNYFNQKSIPSLQLDRFSVAAWFKTSTDFRGDAFVVNKGGFGREDRGFNMNYGLYMTKDEQVRAGFETFSGTNYFISSPGRYSNGQWHYAVRNL